MTAQNFLLRKDKFENSSIVDEESLKQQEKVFQKVAGKVIDKLHISNLTESYIYEKTYNIDNVYSSIN